MSGQHNRERKVVLVTTLYDEHVQVQHGGGEDGPCDLCGAFLALLSTGVKAVPATDCTVHELETLCKGVEPAAARRFRVFMYEKGAMDA